MLYLLVFVTVLFYQQVEQQLICIYDIYNVYTLRISYNINNYIDMKVFLVQCRFDGCSYTAAPKLVQLHIQHQHRTGLAKKIWSLDSAEDIEKWRLERKKYAIIF